MATSQIACGAFSSDRKQTSVFFEYKHGNTLLLMQSIEILHEKMGKQCCIMRCKFATKKMYLIPRVGTPRKFTQPTPE